ncbi:MAG: Asp-tRNA(Asn)/Glu-tRNA(Gln) amidotransferase subunit GatB [Ruminococcaceae bacterium]|nr:Asp-tRNA(Asn)/Glu-tRNA(Gln) amidotransferase subunit GatB [Oscillospiraceae bacterium]
MSVYEAVIGLEVHVELATESKIFCSCPTSFGAPPNTHVCPVCMGLPGALPVLNRKVVEYAIRAGLATGCKIAERTRLDRKNYFYPDLPKAYQISQYEYPLCFDGSISISEEKSIGITRIHIEEDAGKLIHDKTQTLLDFNRCGVPLIEIVSEPDIRSADEAKAYLSELRTLMLYASVSDCKMNEGSFRCDVNLSVRKKGETALGVRTEMKNINSFSFVAKAIEYEFARQVSVIEAGGEIIPETRRFDASDGKTYTMRSKESAEDYRFFPEPDLLGFEVDRQTVERIRGELPVLPEERRKMYVGNYGLVSTDARIITSRPELAAFFERAASRTKYPKIAANMILCDLLALVGAEGFDCPITAEALADIATLSGENRINSSTAKKLIKQIADGETRSPEMLVRALSLEQINDSEQLERVLREVIEQEPKLIADYKNGKTAAKKAIVGKVMAKTAGLANPIILNEVFNKIIN